MTQETAPETDADDNIAAPEAPAEGTAAPEAPAEATAVPGSPANDATAVAPAQDAVAGARTPGAPAAATTPERHGTRRRRAPKQDPLLTEDVATARAAVAEIAEPSQIGPGHRVVAEEDRLAVHLFECTLPGYRGWNWFASLARAPRSRTVTVCEIGLLPGEDALMAPEWLPWSDRVSPEEKAQEEQARIQDGEESAAGPPAAIDPADDDAPAAGRGTDPEPPRDGDRP